MSYPENAGLGARLLPLALAQLTGEFGMSHLTCPNLFSHLSSDITLGNDFQTCFNLRMICSNKSYKETLTYQTSESQSPQKPGWRP